MVSALDEEISKEKLGCHRSPSFADRTGGEHGIRSCTVSAVKSNSMLVGRVCQQSLTIFTSISPGDMSCVVEDLEPYFWGKGRLMLVRDIAGHLLKTKKSTEDIHGKSLG